MVSATGIAMSIRITTGIAVHITSASVLCEKSAGFAPFDFLCWNSE